MSRKVIVRRKKSEVDHRFGRRITKERREKIHAKQQQALELRQAGATYREIASALGYASASGAKDAVDRAMSKNVVEAAKDVVLMDLQRLDEYQKRCTHALRQNGDLSQIDRLMRIMEARYRLMGVSSRTVEELQEAAGIKSNITNNGVMIVQTRPAGSEEEDFIRKMMIATGNDPESDAAREYFEQIRDRKTPELEGSVDASGEVYKTSLEEEDVVDAEVIEEEWPPSEEVRGTIKRLMSPPEEED